MAVLIRSGDDLSCVQIQSSDSRMCEGLGPTDKKVRGSRQAALIRVMNDLVRIDSEGCWQAR